MGSVVQYQQQKRKASTPRNLRSVASLGATIIAAGAASYLFVASGPSSFSLSALGLNPNCKIKGNISFVGKDRIFHVPGQKNYDDAVIRPWHGERWFCTEAEARSAGWRKAYR